MSDRVTSNCFSFRALCDTFRIYGHHRRALLIVSVLSIEVLTEVAVAPLPKLLLWISHPHQECVLSVADLTPMLNWGDSNAVPGCLYRPVSDTRNYSSDSTEGGRNLVYIFLQ